MEKSADVALVKSVLKNFLSNYNLFTMEEEEYMYMETSEVIFEIKVFIVFSF